MKKILLIILLGISPLIGVSQKYGEEWVVEEIKKHGSKRHESSFVECNGKLYALGGRGDRPVEEYDPVSKEWRFISEAPMEFNHFQALSFKGEIYVIAAFQGRYPHETPIKNMLIFNPEQKVWREGPEIPRERLRGSVGVFSRGDKIYLVSGILDGHWDGNVGWFDEYDTKSGEWRIMPDIPHERDHFSAALIGDKVYIAGGRKSSAKTNKVLERTVGEVDVFDFRKGEWETMEEGIPTERAGTSSLGIGKYLVVMNGESKDQIPGHSVVEVLDTKKGEWFRLPRLKQGRHGCGIAYLGGKIYVANGSGNRGGGPEMDEVEFLNFKP